MMVSKPDDMNRGEQAMIKWLKLMKSVICLVSIYALVPTLANAVTIDDINYSSLPGDRVQLTVELSEALAEEPLSFTIVGKPSLSFRQPCFFVREPILTLNIFC